MRCLKFSGLTLLGTLALLAPISVDQVRADTVDIVAGEAHQRSGEAWDFSVTVAHPDSGWDHYVDRWEIIGPDGKVLGVRVLLHPHVQEQPFTRTLAGVVVPRETHYVTIRANCNVDGLGGQEWRIDLKK